MSADLAKALDQLRSQVGDVRRQHIDPVPALWARRFAVACAEDDPVYFDDGAAAAAGWHGTPLPPLLLSATRSWTPGPERAQLGDDGMALADVGYPAGCRLRTLGGGQSLTFHADAVADVSLVAESAVTDARVKPGRSGELLVVALERRYLTRDGELVLVCDETRLFR
jgi:hypothetical protein